MDWIFYESDGATLTWIKTKQEAPEDVAAALRDLGAGFVKSVRSWVLYYPPDPTALTSLLDEPVRVIQGVTIPPKKWPGGIPGAESPKSDNGKVPTTSAPPGPTAKDRKLADRLREMADNMEATIQQKLTTFSNSNYTRRRARMQESGKKEARSLQKLQGILRGLSYALDEGSVPPALVRIRTKAGVERVLGWYEYPSGQVSWHQKSIDRLTKDGITEANFAEAKAALEGLAEGVEDHSAEDEQWRRENEARSLVRQVPGFFPTPPDVARSMIQWAEIEESHKVLEPSAGAGAIADLIVSMHPGIWLVVIEINYTLREVLEGKGYTLYASDFLGYAEQEGAETFDRIVMNPPFEKGQAFDHIQAAYGLLKPDGRLVSVMPLGAEQNGPRRAQDFREWLEDRSYYEVHELAKDAFKKSGTGVATQVVIIDKEE